MIRLPALRRWHVLLAMALVGLGCWWLLIEGLLWLADTLTGGAR
ncbi:MAG: hypothetical protein ACRDVZ_17815 [Jiangellaceae bacterium]